MSSGVHDAQNPFLMLLKNIMNLKTCACEERAQQAPKIYFVVNLCYSGLHTFCTGLPDMLLLYSLVPALLVRLSICGMRLMLKCWHANFRQQVPYFMVVASGQAKPPRRGLSTAPPCPTINIDTTTCSQQPAQSPLPLTATVYCRCATTSPSKSTFPYWGAITALTNHLEMC